jgi:predicted flap endonuclease-1-like 5' DNA nuclease
MNTFFILLVQSKAGATIEILFLLLVAAIIGYITAWLYFKSIYVPRIKTIESEKNELNKDIIALKAENVSLHKKLQENDNEIKELIQEVKGLKTFHVEDPRESDEMELKSDNTGHLHYEKDEALVHFAQYKHLLNYQSFGSATEDERDNLKMISGIGPVIEERLFALDIFTLRQISKFTQQDIDTINDTIIYFSGRIERDNWVEQARELVQLKDDRTELFKRISDRKLNIQYSRIGFAKREEADDLTVISGIGGWIMEKLNILGIYTFRQISNFTDEDVKTVTEAIEYFPGRIERDDWIMQARELVRIAGNKSELLKRIRDRQGRIYFDRLGIAHKHQANNLTLIDGLGLWVEERLNLLGIYTFEQISNLTHEDIETITDVLEIIPGCIEKDNWVGQAHELAKKQTIAVSLHY